MPEEKGSPAIPIIVAIIGLVSAVTVAVIANSDKLWKTTTPHILHNAEYTGTNDVIRRDGQRVPALQVKITLNVEGAVVSGQYSTGHEDVGVVTGRVEGNSLNLRIVSESGSLPGACTLRGTLSSDNSRLDGIYNCPDREQGEIHLTRQNF